jgi:hypothetical protein
MSLITKMQQKGIIHLILKDLLGYRGNFNLGAREFYEFYRGVC